MIPNLQMVLIYKWDSRAAKIKFMILKTTNVKVRIKIIFHDA